LRQFAAAVAIAIDNHLAYEGRARLKSQLALSNVGHVGAAATEEAFGGIVGGSPAIKEVIRKISMVAGTDSSVLISGETGTGKGLVARVLHQLSNRRRAPLITVNCAALPVGIIESELFGHEKGAFTGAVVRRAGRFELADRGTIFLDEIGDLPQEVQAKFLRVLQDREFERVGGTRTLKVDVRVIAATNRFLPTAVANNSFRSDLFYRLNVFPVHLPPLRERRIDILPLAMYLLEKYATRLEKPVHVIDHQAMRRLVAYSWPGNVRELENVIERGLIVSDGPVLELDDDLPAAIKTRRELYPQVGAGQPETTRPHDEAQHLLESLELSGGNHSRAAKSLGIGRTTLWRKLKLHGLTCFLVSALGEDVVLPIWSILCGL
jgi:formate hydrogenlyase transcriptional activator